MRFWKSPEKILMGDIIVINKFPKPWVKGNERIVCEVVGFKDITSKHEKVILRPLGDPNITWIKSPEICSPLTAIEIAQTRAEHESNYR